MNKNIFIFIFKETRILLIIGGITIYLSYVGYHTLTTIILVLLLLSQKVTISLSKNMSLVNSKNLHDIAVAIRGFFDIVFEDISSRKERANKIYEEIKDIKIN
jgi:hypothetical protein